MPSRTHTLLTILTTALAAAAATVLACRHRRLQRALAAERATRRLADAAHHRDLTAFTARLHVPPPDAAVLAEANHILDTAYAARHQYPHDPHTEGGPA